MRRLSKIDNYFYLVLAILIVAIIPFTLINYGNLPEKMPILFNLAGEVAVYSKKTIFTSLRLPFMTLVSFFLILLMHILSLKKLPKLNSVNWFWRGLVFFLTLKMLLSCLLIFFIDSPVGKILHLSIFSISVLGALIMLITFIKLLRRNVFTKGMFSVEKKYSLTITVLVIIYVILVTFPKFM